ncbi:HesA/MoeB/ThiF family protein [Ferruginivarius sediminum]|uniref:Molybdopterin-synthase adenylyltransferase n=1 Tax=Ferruginivarius sediminum TaxID=2661937 RepID=A0A369TDE1_9PROT|nr:molybdopterin-synthase adenylyltransferase MoeB [Ferruginivarius sediminum]RDD63371.1 molybdopterin-synthase adenylyltransferase MoeB [Ferruginivarius sediminum]
MDLTDEQIERYARHLVLPEIGEEGQERLLGSAVLVVGAGGLGAPLLTYLAAAGVGRIGVIDDDRVDLSNLQRQVIHDTESVGLPKVESARRRMAAINPEVTVETHDRRLTRAGLIELIQRYDVVADGSDNFATRYLLNDACYLARRPLVSAAIMRFDGQLSTYKAYEAGPCYRCVFGPQPAADPKQSCADVGVLAMLPGVMGTLQATEVAKELLGIGDGLVGRLVLYDALSAEVRKIKTPRDPTCALCGETPTIRDLAAVDYGDARICAA